MWQHNILGTWQIWTFSKLLLKYSTSLPQIWLPRSQDIHKSKESSLYLCNSTLHCIFSPKFHMLCKSPGQKISTFSYWVIIIVPFMWQMHDIYLTWSTHDTQQHECSLMPHSWHRQWYLIPVGNIQYSWPCQGHYVPNFLFYMKF